MKIYRAGALLACLGVLLGIYEGKIALWMEGRDTPVKVFPYSVSVLPAQDQEALRRGIRAESPRELARLLEDYLS